MAQINELGLDLIRAFEGFRPEPYICPAGVWTIGYGSTHGVNEDTLPITKLEALRLLKEDLRRYEASVLRNVKVPLNENQYSALVSFCYNVGSGNFRASTLLRKLNRGDYSDVPRQLRRWVYGGGRRLSGLVRRREAEGELFQLKSSVHLVVVRRGQNPRQLRGF